MSTPDSHISIGGGGSYLLESQLRDVRSNFLNIDRKIKEIMFNMMCAELDPSKLIRQIETNALARLEAETSGEPSLSNSNFLSVTSISSPLISHFEFEQYLSARRSLVVNEEELITALIRQQRENNHEPYMDLHQENK